MSDFRTDGIVNALTALGTMGDKHQYNRTSRPQLMTEQELDWMYESGRFASTIVDRIPDDCTRKPFEVTTKTNAGVLFEEGFERLNVRGQFNTAHKWARLLGGAGILMVVDDGLPLSAPMDLSRVNDLMALHVFDLTELYVREWYTSVNHPQYGQHKTYNLTPSLSPGMSEVHASRVLPFYGRRIRRRRADRWDYWGQPELERVWQSISDIETATGALATGMHAASFYKLKLKDLKTLLTGSDLDNMGSSRFLQRLQAIRLSQSIINGLAIDADMEDIEPIEMNLRGLIEGYGVFQQNLAFITGIPLSLLFGIHPSGFSNNDETGLENYRQTIATEQHNHYLPNLKRLLEVMAAARLGPTGGEMIPDLGAMFKPMDEIKPAERVELETKMIDAATKAIDKGIITAQEERTRLSQAAFTERWLLQDIDADRERQIQIEEFRRKREAQAEIEDDLNVTGQAAQAFGFDRADADNKRKYVIPKSAVNNAKKAQEWLRTKPMFKGGTATGKRRMRQLAAGGRISMADLVEINAWFARHEGNEEVSAEFKDEPWRDAGYTSFLMWGGATMREYARGVVESSRDDRVDASNAPGAMIAIYPSIEVSELAAPMRAPDFDEPLHCTLVYMPLFTTNDIGRAREVMRYIGNQTAPLELSINGAGLFQNDQWVHVLNPSGMGLTQLRADLCKALDAADLLGPQNHDFIPHMTLGYYPPGNVPPAYVESMTTPWPRWVSSTMKLVIGDEVVFEYPFNG